MHQRSMPLRILASPSEDDVKRRAACHHDRMHTLFGLATSEQVAETEKLQYDSTSWISKLPKDMFECYFHKRYLRFELTKTIAKFTELLTDPNSPFDLEGRLHSIRVDYIGDRNGDLYFLIRRAFEIGNPTSFCRQLTIAIMNISGLVTATFLELPVWFLYCDTMNVVDDDYCIKIIDISTTDFIYQLQSNYVNICNFARDGHYIKYNAVAFPKDPRLPVNPHCHQKLAFHSFDEQGSGSTPASSYDAPLKFFFLLKNHIIEIDPIQFMTPRSLVINGEGSQIVWTRDFCDDIEIFHMCSPTVGVESWNIHTIGRVSIPFSRHTSRTVAAPFSHYLLGVLSVDFHGNVYSVLIN